MLTQNKIEITTPGRGIIDITNQVAELVEKSNITTGLCHVFLHHTSASLVIAENFDPSVHKDMEGFMSRLVPDGDSLYEHTEEGPDDMPSHIRTMLTTSFLTIPVTDGKLALGRWQGLYLWEHRVRSHHRKMTVTVYG